jgi:hypothetical protein
MFTTNPNNTWCPQLDSVNLTGHALRPRNVGQHGTHAGVCSVFRSEPDIFSPRLRALPLFPPKKESSSEIPGDQQ